MFSDSTLYRNYDLLSFGVVSKNSHSYVKRLLRYSSLSNSYLSKAGLSAHTGTETTYVNNLITEADMRTELSSIKPDVTVT